MPSARNRRAGFTLVEVMIVVVILGIIGAIAYPSYLEQTRNARRADAKATLLETAQALERCYSNTMAYNAAACSALVPAVSDEGFYNVAVVSAASTFTLTATATGVQADDTDCATFTINQAGQQGGTNASCW